MAAPPEDSPAPRGRDPKPDPAGNDPEGDDFWDLADEADALPAEEETAAPEFAEGDDDAPSAPEAAEEAVATAAPATPPASDQAAPETGSFSRSVFFAVLIGIFLIIAGVVVFLSFALEGIGSASSGKVKFPIEGDRVTIAAADTYWRKPDREKDTGVVFSARIIPVSLIELGGGQGSGALRFFFENDRGITIGDPITFAVADGTFAPSGERSLQIHATNGFDDVGDHAAYVTDQIGTWHLIVKEGPGPRAVGSEFKELARIPISKQLR